MPNQFDRDDLFGPGKLEAVLDFETEIDDVGDHTPDDAWLADAAVAAAAVTGTGNLRIEIARAASLGFDEDLAQAVLNDGGLQARLRKHWTDNGISPIVAQRAAEPSQLGRMHARLIELAGPAESSLATVVPFRRPVDADKGDAGSDLPTNVSSGPWAVSPHVGLARAAADKSHSAESFTTTHPDWGLEYTQTPTSAGDANIEVRVAPGAAAASGLVRIEIGDDVRLLVLRERRGELVATAKVRGAEAWGENAVRIYRPVAAADLTVQDAALVTDAVRRAPIPEQNQWRKILGALEPAHPIIEAIGEGLP